MMAVLQIKCNYFTIDTTYYRNITRLGLLTQRYQFQPVSEFLSVIRGVDLFTFSI